MRSKVKWPIFAKSILFSIWPYSTKINHFRGADLWDTLNIPQQLASFNSKDNLQPSASAPHLSDTNYVEWNYYSLRTVDLRSTNTKRSCSQFALNPEEKHSISNFSSKEKKIYPYCHTFLIVDNNIVGSSKPTHRDSGKAPLDTRKQKDEEWFLWNNIFMTMSPTEG